MAPIKFEEQIKDKLEKRTLSPSAEGWSKLAERLDADEKDSKKPIFWWLSIAAGLLIMITMSVQFFGTNESEEMMPQVADEEVIDERLEPKSPELKDQESIELVEENSSVEKKDTETIIKEPQILDYKKLVNKKAEAKTELAATSEIYKSMELNPAKEDDKNQLKTDVEVSFMKNAVADALKELKTENTSVTDREIDSLLKLASKELFKEKSQKETSKTVDARALLMSVQDEMGQSFRSRVFDALKDSYKTVKTAVVDRNN